MPDRCEPNEKKRCTCGAYHPHVGCPAALTNLPLPAVSSTPAPALLVRFGPGQVMDLHAGQASLIVLR